MPLRLFLGAASGPPAVSGTGAGTQAAPSGSGAAVETMTATGAGTQAAPLGAGILVELFTGTGAGTGAAATASGEGIGDGVAAPSAPARRPSGYRFLRRLEMQRPPPIAAYGGGFGKGHSGHGTGLVDDDDLLLIVLEAA